MITRVIVCVMLDRAPNRGLEAVGLANSMFSSISTAYPVEVGPAGVQEGAGDTAQNHRAGARRRERHVQQPRDGALPPGPGKRGGEAACKGSRF